MKASTQSSRSFFVWVRLILIINFSLATAKVFVHLLGKVPPSRGLTHMRSMCVGVAETGVEHCSPAKKHEVTFIFSYFCVTKSTKSQQGGLAPSSFRTTGGVHELVARAVRGECVRQMAERKPAILPLPTVSAIPRVRT